VTCEPPCTTCAVLGQNKSNVNLIGGCIWKGCHKYIVYVLLLGNTYILTFQERCSESDVLEQ